MQRFCFTILAVIAMLTAGSVYGQGWHHNNGGHGLWPDSLETVTVTGAVMVDSSYFHPMYYLDENGDGNADYHLSFGPWWYQPESGATRPANGETITIVGGVQNHMFTPVLMVFEINGLVWRESVEYGMNGWNGGHFWDNQGDTLTVTGMVMVDTTYFYEHYFLDTDNDSIPEYKLGFGPLWYEPESGAVRPQDGEVVTVFGRIHDMFGINMFSVYTINGLEWRPFNQPAPWAGMWMNRDHSGNAFAYCVNDSANWINFPQGHCGGMMGGMMWPDSSFVQFWQVHTDSLPGNHDNENFMGFYLNVHDPRGMSMMGGRFGGRHGMMRYRKQHEFRFHYYDEDLEQMGLNEDGLSLKYWDESTQKWNVISGIDVDTQANTVVFSTTDLSKYYTISVPATITGIDDTDSGVAPTEFVLQQNYPNPFNPTTNIKLEVPVQSHVQLSVYNLLGQRIAVLLNENKAAGSYTVPWSGRDDSGRRVSSGIYLVKLDAGEQVKIQRMTLLK